MNSTETTIRVFAEWDAESRVWTATSQDQPGLVTESETMEGLIERISLAIPELLDVFPVIHTGPRGGRRAESTSVRVFLHADRQMVLSA